MEIQLNPESLIQVQSVTVTLSGHGKSVTAADCHSNCLPLPLAAILPKLPIMAKTFLKWPDMVPGCLRS